MTSADLASGKGHRDENFPVASFIIKPEHRRAVMAFYRFARKADDIADHPDAPEALKLERLEDMRATLAGERDSDPEALALRTAQEERSLTPRHGLDLLEAFRRDVNTRRYADFAGLLDYCRYSAMPVGRFVLDVHRESEALWSASDALCAALQIINHLQDCAKDFRDLDRVYIPLDRLAACGETVGSLGLERATPGLARTLRGLAEDTQVLLARARPFAAGVRDARLAYEVALIQRLAEDLTSKLMTRDPLSERVHHRPWETLALAVLAGVDRLRPMKAAS